MYTNIDALPNGSLLQPIQGKSKKRVTKLRKKGCPPKPGKDK